MISFVETAAKAQEELQAELNTLKDVKLRLDEKASLLANKENELVEREKAISLTEKNLNDRNEAMSMWETKKMREEQVQKMHDDALAATLECEKKYKASSEQLAESRQLMEDLAKRELALSEREKTYRQEAKQELVDKFFQT